jgi:hypothetical protein
MFLVRIGAAWTLDCVLEFRVQLFKLLEVKADQSLEFFLSI